MNKKVDLYFKLFLYAGLGTLMIVFISMLYFPKNQNMRIGKKSSETIVSPKQFEIQTSSDQEISSKLLEQKVKQSKKVYKRDFTIENKTDKDIVSLFFYIKRMQKDKDLEVTTSNPV
mgnify:CR=1 FL=1